MAHLYLSATHKSSGKTTLSIGLIRELRRRGHRVQPFKKGPDYIDPLWLTESAGRSCLNLDYHTTPRHEIRTAFSRALDEDAFGFIEGNVGLFDSIDLEGANSNAELAKQLGAPVLLVVDAQGATRGIAPLLLGYQAFDPALSIAGVILNKVGGDRHAANLCRVVEHYTDIPVVGVLPRLPQLGIEERHLGLIPSNEAGAVDATIERIRAVVAEHVDTVFVEALAAQAQLPEC
jgi:cobyrinic acid a,c-diamide synthase